MKIQLIPFGTELYQSSKSFREKMLRQPLGLSLSAYDLKDEDKQFHIAATDSDGIIIGTVILKPISEETANLRQMAISSDYQGRGLGRELISFLEKTALEKNINTIEVTARLDAQGFYAKLGYCPVGETFTGIAGAVTKMEKKL